MKITYPPRPRPLSKAPPNRTDQLLHDGEAKQLAADLMEIESIIRANVSSGVLSPETAHKSRDLIHLTRRIIEYDRDPKTSFQIRVTPVVDESQFVLPVARLYYDRRTLYMKGEEIHNEDDYATSLREGFRIEALATSPQTPTVINWHQLASHDWPPFVAIPYEAVTLGYDIHVAAPND